MAKLAWSVSFRLLARGVVVAESCLMLSRHSPQVQALVRFGPVRSEVDVVVKDCCQAKSVSIKYRQKESSVLNMCNQSDS